MKRNQQRGFMVLALMGMLAIMLILVAASMKSLTHLRRDMKLVEQKQVQRLQNFSSNQTTKASSATPPRSD